MAAIGVAPVPGSSILEWGVASLTMPGQTEPGDSYVVQPFPGGVLVAVIDGLGHGHEAALASQTAARPLREKAGQPIEALLRACHEALKETRGAVISAASFHAPGNTMSWLGVGNVDGVLIRARGSRGPATSSVLALSGLLGLHLPSLHASVVSLNRGDILIFATDGIRSDFSHGVALNETPQQVADRICTRHQKGSDDALVLVARYLGQPL